MVAPPFYALLTLHGVGIRWRLCAFKPVCLSTADSFPMGSLPAADEALCDPYHAGRTHGAHAFADAQ